MTLALMTMMQGKNDWFWWGVRVYYEDTDAGGIVYNANYLRFFERARTEWLRALGLEHKAMERDHGLQLVLSRADIRFRAPARLDDELSVGVALARLRRASLNLDQQARLLDGKVLCTGTVQVACVDVLEQRPRPFPQTFLGVLA
ncbi:MAG: tol-pal system-associated acyl-CoA thioesterase [Chromatiales bacterium]|jgi:acyl-CoA thioester hydrolase|nr:tol-pal system-associated acyl-CoA thioesterase [Chromatiales bacterium]